MIGSTAAETLNLWRPGEVWAYTQAWSLRHAEALILADIRRRSRAGEGLGDVLGRLPRSRFISPLPKARLPEELVSGRRLAWSG